MAIILGNQSLVLRAFTTLVDKAPGSKEYNDHIDFIKSNTVYNSNGQVVVSGESIYKAALNTVFASTATADLAAAMIGNLGLTGIVTQAEGVAYLNANASNRVGAILDLANILSNYAGTSSAVLTAKAAYNATLDYAYNYSTVAANVNSIVLNDNLFSTLQLTTGLDTLTGSLGNDSFIARTLNNVNTLGDADTLMGGAGADTLFADLVSQNNAITPRLVDIETVVIRAQSTTADNTNGNNTSSGGFTNRVQIDAQRSLAVDNFDHVTASAGVTRWESNNSRSDVVIEDVRIGNDQKTSDVTIAMVETDPGNVDFAVYFDQQSLRNASTGTTSLTINLMDTGAAGNAATAATPLLNNPYDQFKLGINGVLTTIQLDKAAVAAADTYEALLTVFQAALAGTTTVASLGANFTITDPISNKAVVGKSIVLTGNAGGVITAPTGSGWYNTTGASVPPTSNIYTTFAQGSTSVSELVTSKVVLDDVGRSNLGGDLVIGGMSTGDTSNYSIYRGVERFEITVNDNSKLQTINSTNNALREVTIASGATSKTVADAYTTTVTNEGDLVVNGDASFNLSLTGATRGQLVAVPVGGTQSAGNDQLPGVENNSATGVHHGVVGGVVAAGFTDVRLIDASAFKGKLGFTAAITQDTIAKYVNLIDVAPAAPGADIASDGNVNFGVRGANFIYTGGNDDDTMTVTIDTAAASSRSTVVSGQSDFTFAFNGGAGNDAMTVTVMNSGLAGGAQAWYNNQKLNANIAIGAGDGDDTIKTPGAGDVIIDAGTGNDTVYTDNTGRLVVTTNANGATSAMALAYQKASTAELAAAQAARVLDATTVTFNPQTADGTAVAPATVVTALQALDDATAEVYAAAPPTHAGVDAAIDTAWLAGALTFAQVQALKAAYNTVAAPTLDAATLITLVPFTYTDGAAVGGNVTAAEFAAGNTLLATYLAAAKAAQAANTAATANETYQNTLLNGTQILLAAAQETVSKVWEGAGAVGTQVTLDALNVLKGALIAGAIDATVVAALRTALQAGAITPVQAGALYTAATLNGVGTIDAVAGGELAGVTAILTPLITAASAANTTALAALATATTNNTKALDDVATGAVAPAAQDSFGTVATTAAQAAAKTASDNAGKALAAAQAIETALNGLKAAVPAGASDTQITDALTVAGTTIAAEVVKAAAAGYVIPDVIAGNTAALFAVASTAPGLAATVSATEKAVFDTGFDNALTNPVISAMSVDTLLDANRVTIDRLTTEATDKAAVLTATTTAATEATLAAASGGAVAVAPLPNAGFANFAFNTSNQRSDYDRLTMDDRSLVDLKSDANNSNNFFNSTLKVTFKGIDSSVTVAGTGYKTTDLELNQSIKLAINSDAVLSKLLVATDGPANTLVVTSLIDGAQVTGNLAVTVTIPTTVLAADLPAAAAAYGLAVGSTEAQVLAAMTAAKLAFDAKGDYTTQFAESGAANANVVLVGANSTSSSDNTITLGTGNDVLVLGTTETTVDMMTSSNEKVIYSGSFGNDTIVNFDVSGNGIDMLDFTALNGRGNVALNSFSLDKSIVIAAPTAAGATVLTAAQIAALFTDSATAISHVYVAVDSTNIGSIWQVADAAGTAAGNVVATLVGTIDLADTAWGTLTAANFA